MTQAVIWGTDACIRPETLSSQRSDGVRDSRTDAPRETTGQWQLSRLDAPRCPRLSSGL
jgi:hypothetical protein